MCFVAFSFPLLIYGYLRFWHSVGLTLLGEATIQLDSFIELRLMYAVSTLFSSRHCVWLRLADEDKR